MDVRLHFVRDLVDKGVVQVHKVHSYLKATDFLTKAINSVKFSLCMDLIGFGKFF